MTRGAFAIWTLLVGSALGIIGTTMFYGQAVGLSFPIFIGLLTAAVVGSGVYAKREMAWFNLWPVPLALFFAVMVAVRANEGLTFLNISATLILGALALHYVGQTHRLDMASAVQHVADLVQTGVRVSLPEPMLTLREAFLWFRDRRPERSGAVVAVVRGLFLAIPVLVVFGVLLASADLIFANYLSEIRWLVDIENFDELVGRTFQAGFLAWVSVGVISYGLARGWYGDTSEATTPEDASPATADTTDGELTEDDDLLNEVPDFSEPAKRKDAPAIRIGMIEAGMVLGSLNLMFGAFVLVQAVYLFGGASNIALDGLTFAAYARRGFFELVTVAVLTMGLLLMADWFTLREGPRQTRLFRVLSVVMIALVGVMLVSAARRMSLYTDAYGYTQLRVWVSVFMAWMAVLFVFFTGTLFRLRKNLFSLGLVLVSAGYLGTLNMMNPDLFIAERNIQRAFEMDEELDACYLRDLSIDALPVIVEAYETTESDTVREALGMVLREKQARLTSRDFYADQDTFFAMNLGRERAKAVLEPIAETVAAVEFDDAFLYNCAYNRIDPYDAEFGARPAPTPGVTR